MRTWKMTHHYTNNFVTCFLLGIMVIALALMVAPVYAGGGNSGHHGNSAMKGGKGGSAGKKGPSTSVETVSASPASEVNVASVGDESADEGHGGKSDNSGQGGKGKGKDKDSSDSNDVAASSSSSSSEAKGRGNSGGGKGGGHGSDGNGKKNSDSWSSGGNHSDVAKDSTTEDDDSDRPDWAGKDGDHSLKPGGGNSGGDTKKGGDYGDLFVMSRDDDGTLLEYHADGTLCEDGDGDCYPAALLFDEEGNLIEDVVFVLSPDAEAPDNVEEVELGRLNISRAPNKVLEHALAEALSKLDPDMDGYLIDSTNWQTLTDTAGRLLSPETMLAIDSPLENLALFQALLDGYDPLSEATGVTIESGGSSITVDYDILAQIAAAALAAASDKHDTMGIDEVSYLSKFLEVEEKLNSLVEDIDDWYTPDTIYNVEMSVLATDDTTTPPATEWVEVNLLDPELDLFHDIPDIVEDGNGIDVFTQAVDDALQVIEFIHDNVVL
ncbi:hypothetical protein [Desulfopila sp. IMCC35008]|uniref:hypothetical protein n=1 Tax=Desulfopila sp. IMCC35008 TaxID=2653858 RepID=UPI0013D0F27B|nr:hypothetical protein [Desulfopila sp. IMCC35008]